MTKNEGVHVATESYRYGFLFMLTAHSMQTTQYQQLILNSILLVTQRYIKHAYIIAGGTAFSATSSEGHYHLRCLQSNVHCAASRRSEDMLLSLTVSKMIYLHSPVQVRAQNLR